MGTDVSQYSTLVCQQTATYSKTTLKLALHDAPGPVLCMRERLTGFYLPKLFMKRKQCWEASHASLVIIFMGDKMVRQFAVQTIGCGIGAMAFACDSVFLGLNGTCYIKQLEIYTQMDFLRGQYYY